MELRQLRYFAEAARLLSFSEAARSLCIAQSTLSQQIRQLEDELGVQLFDRQTHSIALTEAGREVLPCALRTICEADTCRARVADLASLAGGELNIGVTYSFSPILTETLVEFTRSYPGVKLNVFYKPMAELMTMLRERRVDFVLAFRPSERMDDIESHVLFDNHLSVILRQGHPLADRPTLAPADLCAFSLALPCPGLQARNALDGCLAISGASLQPPRVELNEVNILLELVKRSDMITVLSEATVYNQSGVRAIPLSLPGSQMEGCVHMLRSAYRKKSALTFITLLKDSPAVSARRHNWFT